MTVCTSTIRRTLTLELGTITEGEEFTQVEHLCPYSDHLDGLQGGPLALGEE